MRVTNATQFITIDNKITINPTFLEQLKHIRKPIRPICAVGSILVGKSSLLNNILQLPIFQAGNSTKPTTIGVWAYLQPIISQGGISSYNLWLDVQGFDRLDGKYEIDLILMSLMMLLCKNMIYINRGALQSSTLARISEIIKLLPKKVEEELVLTLIQSDFNLKLLDMNGQTIDQEEYLDYCLDNLRDKKLKEQLSEFFIDSKQQPLINTTLLPNRAQQKRYNKRIRQIRNKIKNTQQKQIKNSDFIIKLQTAISMINQYLQSGYQRQFSLKQHSMCFQKNKQEELKIVKSQLRTIINNFQDQIQKQFPLQQAMINLKYDQIKLSTFNSNRTVVQIQLGTCFFDQILEKSKKITVQKNQKSIEREISVRIQKYVYENCNRVKMNCIEQFIERGCEQLVNTLSYLKNKRKQVIIEFWRLTLNNIFVKQTQKCEEFQKQRLIYQQQLKKNANQFQTENNTLKHKLKQLQQNTENMKIQLQQLEKQNIAKQVQHSQFVQLRTSLQNYQQLIYKNLNRQQTICQQMQQKLVIDESQMQNDRIEQSKCHGSSELLKWTQKIQKIQKYFCKNQEQSRKQLEQKNRMLDQQKLRIQSLQKMNKMLRKQLQQKQGDTYELICQKYGDLQKDYKNLQHYFLQKYQSKQKQNLKLRKQLDLQQQNSMRSQEELQILRVSLKDRGKGTEFLQKIIQQKQILLFSTRNQLLQTIQKCSNEISSMNKQKNRQLCEMANQLASATTAAERLQKQNSVLCQKLAYNQQNSKKKYESLLQEKQVEINFLKSQLKSLESSVSAASEAYQQVTQKMEQIICCKEKKIFELSNEYSNLKLINNKLEYTQNQTHEQYQEIKRKYRILQTEKDKQISEIKNINSLLEHKCNHLTKNIQKSKLELREKQMTFEVMLKQLRGQNLLKYNKQEQKQNMRELQKMIVKGIQGFNPPDQTLKSDKKEKRFISNSKKIKSDFKQRKPLALQEFNQVVLNKQSPIKPQNLQFKFNENVFSTVGHQYSKNQSFKLNSQSKFDYSKMDQFITRANNKPGSITHKNLSVKK